jgi:hypothetical protein
MKLAARQLAAPKGIPAKVNLTAVEVKLAMSFRRNATLKGRPCETG